MNDRERPRIASREEWLAARKSLLREEKALTRARDRVNAARRELPWVPVDKGYVFDTTAGRRTLGDLFAGRSQLIVYHFMFGPGWREGCVGCSFLADHIDGANRHLAHHDVTLTAVSRAPLAEILPFKRRMGWRFDWVSSRDSDFNFDYQVSFTPDDIAGGRARYNFEPVRTGSEESHGISVFCRDPAGRIFHTYSTYARGGEEVLGAYMYLDLTPWGRNETGPMSWVRHHDRYDDRRR